MYSTAFSGTAPVKAFLPNNDTVKAKFGFRKARNASSMSHKSIVRAEMPRAPIGMPPNAKMAFPEIKPRADDAPTTGRKILFAVDGTVDAEEGLRWLAKQIARKGDTVHLAHVICNLRTPGTAVGSLGVGTQWSPSRDEAVFNREYLLRLEHEAKTMLSNRFIPSLQFTGIKHEVDLLQLKVAKSAGSIGEVLSTRAADINADLLVIASHGAGVLADYGSVARWCSENSPVPTLLLPPAVLQAGAGMAPSSNAILVGAIDDSEGLKQSFDFAVKHFARPGDSIFTILVKQVKDEDEAVAVRKQLIAQASRWQEESDVDYAGTLNVAVDVVTEAASNASAPPENTPEGSAGSTPSPAGVQLCTYATDLGARTVVLQHHGHSMMREMMYGPLTLHVTKYCSRPLVVLDPAHQQQRERE